MQAWQRGLWFDQAGVPWINPSPNLRTLTAAALYPGVAMLETTNVSVGRGTDAAFEQIGAVWIASDAEAVKLADVLTARKITGVTFAPATFTPEKPYPFAGLAIHGIRITVTDRQRLDAPALGAELLAALHALYPTAFQLSKASRIVVSATTMDALAMGKDPREVVSAWEPALAHFREQRVKYLLYGYLPSSASY